jgi:hypothetical protein
MLIAVYPCKIAVAHDCEHVQSLQGASKKGCSCLCTFDSATIPRKSLQNYHASSHCQQRTYTSFRLCTSLLLFCASSLTRLVDSDSAGLLPWAAMPGLRLLNGEVLGGSCRKSEHFTVTVSPAMSTSTRALRVRGASNTRPLTPPILITCIKWSFWISV